MRFFGFGELCRKRLLLARILDRSRPFLLQKAPQIYIAVLFCISSIIIALLFTSLTADGLDYHI